MRTEKFKNINKKYLFIEKIYLNGFYNHSKYSYSLNNFMNLQRIKKYALNPIRNNKSRFIKKAKYGTYCKVL